MQYKELKMSWGGKTFLFVTRASEQPISQQEAIEYLRGKNMKKVQDSQLTSSQTLHEDEVSEKKEQVFRIPDGRTAKSIFMQDLRSGFDYCEKKYGVSKEAIVAEAQRVLPHMHVEKLNA